MKKRIVLGFALGIAAVTATAVMVDKISKEMKNDPVEEEFDSPFGDNWIKISLSSSETAGGFMCIKIQAETDRNEDSCKLMVFAKKDAAISAEWEDDDHFKLLIGSGKHKQCCDVSFSEKEITARYYMVKI